MSDDYNITSTNWWDKSRFDVGPGGSSSSSSSGIASFGGLPWLPHEDTKERSSMESQAFEWSQMLLRGDHHKGDVVFDSAPTSFPLESPPLYAGPAPPFHVADGQHSTGLYGGHYSPHLPPQVFWTPQVSNTSPHWDTSSSVATRPNLFPAFLQPQLPSSSPTEDKTRKRSGGETPPAKRARSEANSNMPPFKARREKMGDRITALQQLVSPFGKTDTASVLSEAIEYIKLLHEQVLVLSTPYMKIHRLQNAESEGEGQKHDLRSRGLCLVPVSSTFPVAHETAVDIWTPAIGGGFR